MNGNAEWLELLTRELNDAAAPGLLVVDENAPIDQFDDIPSHPGWTALTNRQDIAHALAGRGVTTSCSDYAFDQVAATPPQSVVYRISKEKAVVHYIINQSGSALPPGGRLVLIGHKREGLLTYGKRAARYFCGESHLQRGNKGYAALTLVRGDRLAAPLPDSDYPSLRRCIEIDDISLVSKPGIYGWQKIDQGSLALLDALDLLTAEDQSNQAQAPDILDLGCGYGLLSVLAQRRLGGFIIATDNNLAAIAACTHNFETQRICGQVIADDCAQHIDSQFDWVLCNPPFHQGFKTSKDLTRRFVEQAAARLKPAGTALFVVNQFVAIERHAAACFSNSDEVLRRDGFKILRMCGPKRPRA